MTNPAELVERYVTLSNHDDIDGVLACCADNIMFETVMNPRGSMRLQGKAQVREVLAGTMAAFKDRSHRLASIISQGNRVAAETVFTGVALAELGDGVRPGDKVAIRGATIFEIENGLIARITDYS
ncbi:nuclear transport factor 2 family protein [Hirschia maritima]|uniref:nuclear transport factor 2 family protein n=1 Tax=Hirschia maritima TaxID=1121961 RepID=UPI00039CB69C|nr:nuclear transport factor 2 family protein [Hirschia maritima]